MIRSGCSWQKSDCERINLDFFTKEGIRDLLMIRANHSKKTYFFYVFDSYSQFFPLFCPSAHPFHHSLLSRCFLKSDRSNLLFKKSNHERIVMSLFTKERPWGIRSGHSWQKSNGAICSFSWANRSLAHKKRAIWLKNQWANFQPWIEGKRRIMKDKQNYW